MHIYISLISNFPIHVVESWYRNYIILILLLLYCTCGHAGCHGVSPELTDEVTGISHCRRCCGGGSVAADVTLGTSCDPDARNVILGTSCDEEEDKQEDEEEDKEEDEEDDEKEVDEKDEAESEEGSVAADVRVGTWYQF